MKDPAAMIPANVHPDMIMEIGMSISRFDCTADIIPMATPAIPPTINPIRAPWIELLLYSPNFATNLSHFLLRLEMLLGSTRRSSKFFYLISAR